MKQYIHEFLEQFEYQAEAAECLEAAYEAIQACGQEVDSEAVRADGQEANGKESTSEEFTKLLRCYKEDINCDFNYLVARMQLISKAAGIHEYTGNLLLFICLSRQLKAYYEETGIDLSIWHTSMMDLKWKNTECQLVHGIWGTFVPSWFTRFYRMTRFGFGKLQFETVAFGRNYQKGSLVLAPDSQVLNVHIPRTGTRLDRDSLNCSYKLGREFYEKRLEGRPLVFVCKSWMLYPRNLELLSEHSNLRGFMSDYDIIEQGDYPDYSEVWRLFDTAYTGKPDDLPGNTSLRRGYKSWITQGKKTGWGYGVSVSAGIDSHDFRLSRDSSKGSFSRYNPSSVSEDMIGLGVADTDFLCPKEILEAIQERVELGSFGYTYRDGRFEHAVADWQRQRFGWKVDPGWVGYSAGVIPAICCALRTFTQPGDKVVIQQPVYDRFAALIEDNGRHIANNPLRLEDGRYSIDFEDLERKLKDQRTTMMILCNPHNPTGRVLTKEELLEIGRLCLENHVLIVSDEIHQDIVYSGCHHISIASLSPELAQNTITCVSPGKTFNVTSLFAAAWITANPWLKLRMIQSFKTVGGDFRNIMSTTAVVSAYTRCACYADQQIAYLEETKAMTEDFFRQHLPQIKLISAEATYLLWLDCRGLGFQDQQELMDFFKERCRIAVNSGDAYGEEGRGFVRMNIASPQPTILEALRRIKEAIEALEHTQTTEN